MDPETYTFEKIVAQKRRKGRKVYLVQWANGPSTWEPASSFVDKTVLPRRKRRRPPLACTLGQPTAAAGSGDQNTGGRRPSTPDGTLCTEDGQSTAVASFGAQNAGGGRPSTPDGALCTEDGQPTATASFGAQNSGGGRPSTPDGTPCTEDGQPTAAASFGDQNTGGRRPSTPDGTLCTEDGQSTAVASFGAQNAGGGRPSTPDGSPCTEDGQPTATASFGAQNAGGGRPSTPDGTPCTEDGQPTAAASSGDVSTGGRRPSTPDGTLCTEDGQPTAAASSGDVNTGGRRPSTPDRTLCTEDGQSTAVASFGAQNTGGGRPSTPDGALCTEDGQPTAAANSGDQNTGGQRPSTPDRTPCTEDGRPTATASFGAQNAGGGRPSTPDGTPCTEDGQPTAAASSGDVSTGGRRPSTPDGTLCTEILDANPDPATNTVLLNDEDTWRSVFQSQTVIVACKASATKEDVLEAVKCARALPATHKQSEKETVHGKRQLGKRLLCHMCGFRFTNSRISQHFRRHHKITDTCRLKQSKEDMRKFSSDMAERVPELPRPEKLTCATCGARVRHLSLHLKRNHHMQERAVRKVMKDAAFANELEMELMSKNSAPATSEQPAKEPNLLELFAESKTGWRKKPTTALRQLKQLKKIFGEVHERCGEGDPSTIMRCHMDTLEEVLLAKLPDHSALVKSVVIALLEFQRYVSVREPENSAAWDAVGRRLETWKRDASLRDQHREADLQDRMGEDNYLPSKEELSSLRKQVHEELHKMSGIDISKRSDAVKMRRLIVTAILLDNFQRSGTITNATLAEYKGIQSGILRVVDHMSRTSYGSANLVVSEIELYLHRYVRSARKLLVKDTTKEDLFPSAEPAEDLGEVCEMFGVRKFNPTLLRKAASTAAYSDLTEAERRRVANHMTHRPETAYKAYSAKNRRGDALESVKKMKELMYGREGRSAPDDESVDDGIGDGVGDFVQWEESTVPSSAGALYRRQLRVRFSQEEQAVIAKEARRLRDGGKFVTNAQVLTMMARHKPYFGSHSPKAVENKLRAVVAELRLDQHWGPRGMSGKSGAGDLTGKRRRLRRPH